MFRPAVPTTRIGSTLALFELIFHASVRHIRKSNGNAIVGLLVSIAQSLVGIGVMLIMFWLIGRSMGNQLRGDYILYIMSGIFSFMAHAKAIKAVSSAEGPTSSMMKHAPMNTIVSVSAAALSALYLQTLSAAVILFGYHALYFTAFRIAPSAETGLMAYLWPLFIVLFAASGIGNGSTFRSVGVIFDRQQTRRAAIRDVQIVIAQQPLRNHPRQLRVGAVQRLDSQISRVEVLVLALDLCSINRAIQKHLRHDSAGRAVKHKRRYRH